MRAAFLVSHLSGSGHLVRTLALARALAALDVAVTVLSGGRPLDHLDTEGVELVQLPPLSVQDFDYTTLRDPTGAPADAPYLAARRERILTTLHAFAPDVLVTETYPFGRRRLGAEFEAAITAVPTAQIIASARDIPEPTDARRRAEAAGRLCQHYAGVLVHGEAEFLTLDAHWPLPEDLRTPILYTGYIGVPDLPETERSDTILVAGGAGPAGAALLQNAALAARLSQRPWHLLAPKTTPAPPPAPNLRIEPPRRDYPALLARAACSLSLAGYNTVMDLAACRTPAVVVPFAGHGEREQAIRAARLATLPGFTVLSEAEATPERLAAAAEAAARAPARPAWPFPRDGAARAATAILDLAKAKALP
ncbi:MAG: glycosyltransferase [Pseudomonadota bacterium]